MSLQPALPAFSPAQARTADASASARSGASQANLINYDAFLQLLVAQMKNQDPTEPTESSEYLAQFAAFSNVEQGIQINERLDVLLSQGMVMQAGSLVGKTYTKGDVTGVIKSVTFENGGLSLTLEGGKKVTLGDGATIS
ncbi:MAG: flagellar hook assembly protein FlgD [Rhizobiaceae bacterium]|jgi:flagellar basal-body rod modification protein FlgD|nr:flagellar hook assembly protein FlgD [Rhizobiaceae bacterium]